MVSMIVGTELDDNAIRDVSNDIIRRFDRVGENVGGSFMSKFADGAASASPKLQKAMDKAADATGKLRSEQQKLDALLTSGASRDKVVASSERVAKARRDEARAVSDARSVMESADRTAANFHNTLRNLATESLAMNTVLREQDIDAVFGKLGGISTRAVAAASGVALVGAAAVVSVQQLYELGSQWDDITDRIALHTGKLGGDLDSLVSSVRELGPVTAAPLEVIGDTSARVSQSIKGLNDRQRDDLTKTLSEYQAMSGESVDIVGFGKTLSQFGVAPENSMAALNDLYEVSTDTGMSINDLLGTMDKAGKAAKEFGLDFGETAGMLSVFQQAGLDLNRIGPSLTAALKNFAKDGRDAPQALGETVSQIERLIEVGNTPAAQKLASETFGKGFIDIFGAIKDGRLDTEALASSLDDTDASLQQVLDSTKDWQEEWQQITNKVKTGLQPAAEYTFGGINAALSSFGNIMSSSIDWISGMGTAWEALAGLITGNPLDAQIRVQTGPMTLDPSGNMVPTTAPPPGPDPLGRTSGGVPVPSPTGPQSPLEVILGPPTNAPAPPPPAPTTGGLGPTGVAPNFYTEWYERTNTAGGGGSSRDALPDAPVLPQQYTPTGGMPTAVASAQTRLDEVEHDVAEKTARVNQLVASNVATEADITKARNDLAKTQQDQLQAQRALAEAQQATWKEMESTAKSFSSGMDSIGAQLDSDFGLSDGLPGLMENLTKAIANITFAPLLGQLEAIKQANGDEGSGLFGIAASNGAFGPRFMPDRQGGYADPSRMGPAALQPRYGGYPGDAALLANVPSGRYSQEGNADLVKGLGDCSSAIEDLINIMDGRPTGGRSMSTQNMAEWLTGRGFLPGLGGPGDFRVGFNAGHAQATLPGGTNFNWGNDAAAASGGTAPNSGAFDPSFTAHYYRPAAGGPVLAPSYTPTYTAPDLYSPDNTSVGLTDPVPSSLGPAPLQPGPLPPLPTPGSPGAPGGGSLLPGMPMPQSAMFGPPTGQEPIGSSFMPGRAPAAAGPGMSTGVGGIPLAALQAGASSLDMLAPGAGAAANLGIQLANRSIGFLGQQVGNFWAGVGETFTLSGSTNAPDIMKSLPGRFLGAIAGARPSVPTNAGGGVQQNTRQSSEDLAQRGGAKGGALVNIEAVHQQPGQSDTAVANQVANQVRAAELSNSWAAARGI